MIRLFISALALLFTLYYFLNNPNVNDDVKLSDRAEHEGEKVQKILDQRTENLQQQLDAQMQQQ